MSENQPITKEDENTMKIKILKKAVLDERKKTKVFESEIKSLQDIISEKDEQIFKLRSENLSISESLSKNDTKSYYDNMFKVKETSDAELTTLKAENEKLTEQISLLETDNKFLKDNLDDCLISYQTLQSSSSEEIESLKQKIDEHLDQTKEDQNKIKIMSAFFRECDIQKATLEEKNYIHKQTIEKLLQDNNALANQVNTLDTSVMHLVEKIEELTMLNYQLRVELDKTKQYPRNYLFKGLLVRQSRKIDTEVSFSKYTNAIAIKPEDDKEIVILIKEINEITREKSNRICIAYSDDQSTSEIRLDFEDNQTDFVMEYAKDLQMKYNKKKEKIMYDSLDVNY